MIKKEKDNPSIFPIGSPAFEFYRVAGNQRYDIYVAVPEVGMGYLRNALAKGVMPCLVVVVDADRGEVFKFASVPYKDVRRRLDNPNIAHASRGLNWWLNLILFSRVRESISVLRNRFMVYDSYGPTHGNWESPPPFPNGQISEYEELIKRGVKMDVGKLLALW